MGNSHGSDPILKVNMISESEFTVQGHGVHTAFREMVEGLKSLGGVDVAINTFRPADITHIQTVGAYGLAHLLFGRGKKVVSVHVIPESFVGSLVGAKYWQRAAGWYLRWFYNRADRLLAVSEEVRRVLVHGLKVKPPVDVVYNTIDAAQYTPTPERRRQARSALKLDANQFVVISVGQVQPRKRFDHFVQLAQQHPSWRFFWVGGIPFKHLGAGRAALEQSIRQAPASLTVTGVIPLEQVRPYYWAADAFVLLSTQENHPMAVIEAAAAGLPVVLRDIKAYEDTFGPDAVYGDDERFGAILDRLRTDSDYRNGAVSGSARIARRYDNQTGAQKLLAEYQLTLMEA